MGSTLKLIVGPVDLEQLLERLQFTEETLPIAVLEQSKLYMEAARFRIKKMRQRQQAELELEQRRARMSLTLRATLAKSGDKITESNINDRLSANGILKDLKVKVADAEQLEEWARNLQEAMRMRRDMLQVYARMLGQDGEMRISSMDVGSLARKKKALRQNLPPQEDV